MHSGSKKRMWVVVGGLVLGGAVLGLLVTWHIRHPRAVHVPARLAQDRAWYEANAKDVAFVVKERVSSVKRPDGRFAYYLDEVGKAGKGLRLLYVVRDDEGWVVGDEVKLFEMTSNNGAWSMTAFDGGGFTRRDVQFYKPKR